MKNLPLILLVLLALAVALTVWATQKSAERTACYKTAKSVEDCEQPGPVERAVRWTHR